MFTPLGGDPLAARGLDRLERGADVMGQDNRLDYLAIAGLFPIPGRLGVVVVEEDVLPLPLAVVVLVGAAPRRPR